MIRTSVVGAAIAIFLAISGGIFVQLMTGGDPALAQKATTASQVTTKRSSSNSGSGSSSGASAGSSSGTGSASSQSGSSASSEPAPVTTSAS